MSSTAKLTAIEKRILLAFRFRNKVAESILMHRLADVVNLGKHIDRVIAKGFLTVDDQNGAITYRATAKLTAAFERKK